MTLQEQIDFFFAPPSPEQTSTSRSPLHLARREIQDCLVNAVMAEDAFVAYAGKRHRLFATVMVVMSGLDLLGKFYAGNDLKRGVHDRFTAFVAEFVFAGDPSASEYAEVLYYGCRNPLLHSFSLHQGKYVIAVAETLVPPSDVVRRMKPKGFVISVEGLARAFVKAVLGYEAKVRATVDLQADFCVMFPSYGSIGVQDVEATR